MRAARATLAVFGLTFAVNILVSTGRIHVPDEASALFQARGLVEAGTIAVPESSPGFEFYGKRDLAGRPRAPYGPAHAVALAPFYAVGRALARAPGVPPEAADLVATFGCVLGSAAFGAAAAAALFLLMIRRGLPRGAALLAIAGVALGTPLLFYAATLFSEPLAAALFAGATLALFGAPGPARPGRAAVAGALLGAAVLARPMHAVGAVVFGAAILVRDGRAGARAFLALGGAAALGLAVYFCWNVHLYGNPLDFGYPEVAEGGRRLNDFSTPLARGLFGFLLSPGKSVFLFAPVALAAIAGLRALWARDRALAFLAAAMPLAYVLAYARYAQWEGGYCHGPRYLVPALVLLGPAVAALLAGGSRRARGAVCALAAAGLLVQALGLATSFLEAQRHSGYYDASWRYRLEWSALHAHGELLARYAGALARGEPAPPLGRGFDRWFLFLNKAGVAWPPIAAAAGAALALGVACALALARTRADHPPPDQRAEAARRQ